MRIRKALLVDNRHPVGRVALKRIQRGEPKGRFIKDGERCKVKMRPSLSNEMYYIFHSAWLVKGIYVSLQKKGMIITRNLKSLGKSF